jgi:RNA polymerase sigma factor (sigma-70 family)
MSETSAHDGCLTGDDQPSLSALLLRARSGEDRDAADVALGALVERLYPMCERFLARRLRSFRDGPDAAADAAQETMVRIANGLDGCRATNDRELIAWMLVVARRTLIDLYRSPASGLAARALAVELDDALGTAQDRDTAEDSNLTPRSTLLALAMQAYNALSAETAELLWWRLIRGAEWSEVAEQMGISPTGAKRRFQRAQSTLQRRVAQLVSSLPSTQRADVEGLVSGFSATGTKPAKLGHLPKEMEGAA